MQKCLSYFLMVLLGALGSQASIVSIDDVPTMAKQSDVVFHGVAKQQSSERGPDGRVITLTQFEVLDGLKGTKTGRIITLYQVGGSLPGVSYYVSGAQHYHVGEEVVLFGLSLDDMVVSYGVGVGKFDVLREKKRISIKEDLHDLLQLIRKADGEFELIPAKPRVFPSLDGFKKTIRQSLGR